MVVNDPAAVTCPAAAAGAAHVPSPRQNVELLALVPLFKFVTGKLPVTPPLPDAARLIFATRDAATVPVETFVPLSDVIPDPSPVTVVAATVAAVTVPVSVGETLSTVLPVPVDVVTPVPPFATGSVPEISAVRLTAPNVGAPAAFPCKTVVVVPNDPSDAGAAPAPPPSVIALAVSNAELASVVVDEK